MGRKYSTSFIVVICIGSNFKNALIIQFYQKLDMEGDRGDIEYEKTWVMKMMDCWSVLIR